MSAQHLNQQVLESFEDVFPRFSKDKHLKLEQYGKTQIIVRTNSRVCDEDVVRDVVNEKMYEFCDMQILGRKGRLNGDGWVFPAGDYRLVVTFLQQFNFYNNSEMSDYDPYLEGDSEDDEDAEEAMWMSLMAQSSARAPRATDMTEAQYLKIIAERDAAIRQRDEAKQILEAVLEQKVKDEKKNGTTTSPSANKKAKKETEPTVSAKKKTGL